MDADGREDKMESLLLSGESDTRTNSANFRENDSKNISRIGDLETLSFHSESESEWSNSDGETEVTANTSGVAITPFHEDLFETDQPLNNFNQRVPEELFNGNLSFQNSSDNEESSKHSESDLFCKSDEDQKAASSNEDEKAVSSESLCQKIVDVYEFSDSDEDLSELLPSYSNKRIKIQPSCSQPDCDVRANSGSKEVIAKLLGNKNKVEVKNQLLNHLRGQQAVGLPVTLFTFNSQSLCLKCCARESGISLYTVRSVIRDFESGLVRYDHGNTGVTRHSAASSIFINWMTSFISLYGQQAPDEPVHVLPSFLTIKDMYEIYKSEADEPHIHLSNFYKLFHESFGHRRRDKTRPCVRISSYSTHARCDVCLALIQMQRNSKSIGESDVARSLRLKHRECYSGSREYVESLRHLTISDPEGRLLIQLDDMDNMKSYLPRVLEQGKKTSKLFKLPSKITGTIMYSSFYPANRKINIFINHNNFEQSSNKVVSVLFLLLQDFVKDNKKLPRILHVNADNCWRENKNKFVLGFLAALVELNVFKEVTFEFLMVGHTGNACDQLFSILTKEFKSEIQTVEDLISKIVKSPIHPQPKVHRLLYSWNWKAFLEPHFSSTILQNHTAYNAFQIKSENCLVKLRAKKYPQYREWYPQEGIKLLKDGINFSPVPASGFREEELSLDKVLSDLRKYYLPSLSPKDKRRVSESWERLSNMLTQLPMKHHPSMKIQDLPRQEPVQPVRLPDALELFDDHSEPPELIGQRHAPLVQEANFKQDVDIGMDVVILTFSKIKRPWMGRVLNILSKENFQLQWYNRKSRSRTFKAMLMKDGSPYVSTCSFDSVMFWEVSINKSEDSFDLSEYWLKRISHEYDLHDELAGE